MPSIWPQCDGDCDYNERSHNASENSAQNCAVQSRNLEPDRRIGSAAIGHGLDRLATFPWFRLVPRHLGSAMIVWVTDEGGLLLARA
jgi:hypothetical protein